MELNPKDSIGRAKAPLSLNPLSAAIEQALAHHLGNRDYGPRNWRGAPVSASVYIDAALRHIAAWYEGEERDPDGLHNLGAVMACCAILIDAKEYGTLQDDRPAHSADGMRARELLTQAVASLQRSIKLRPGKLKP